MIVLVCGGRGYDDQRRVFAVLDALQPELVIQGGAKGADFHARAWATARGKPCATFDAPWASLGRKAGPVRNGWMLEFGRPDLVLAFPGGPGTADMMYQARSSGVEVREER